MEHGAFIAWMCCFPISQAVVKVLESKYCRNKEYSSGTEAGAVAILAALWLGVGYALW
jgi:hypothetical protein